MTRSSTLTMALAIAAVFVLASSGIASADNKKKANTGKTGIYMNYGSIKSETTEKGHADWIERTNNNSKPPGGKATHGGGSRH